MMSTNLLNSFAKARSGSVATFFALSLVGIIGVAGLATDYSRAASSKAALAAAADSAALAGARLAGTPAQREAVARATFKANADKIPGIKNVSMTPTNVLKDNSNYGYKVAASGEIDTYLAKMFGDEMRFETLAEAIGAIRSHTEVALVLDTTYSMTGWKINTLKQAAAKMVDELQPLAPEPQYLKIGIVPFSQYVNVGLGYRNQSWLNVPSDWTETVTPSCYQVPKQVGTTNCRTENYPAQPPVAPGTCYNDGVPYSCGGWGGAPAYSANVCDPVYDGTVNYCPPSYKIQHKWNGCVGSRAYPLNIRDSDYHNRIPGLMDISCGTEMLDLSTNATTVKQRIANLTPNGETYIPSGLVWGWRMLSPQAPLAARVNTPASITRKFIVLMTDGLNTKSPNYPGHDGSDGALSNDLVKQTCAAIAADSANKITVFTVAFDVTDANIKSILNTCAKNTGGKFFDAQNATDFLTAFSNISTTIAELRLSK